MRFQYRIVALLATLLLLYALPLTAYADDMPDESVKGTITVEMKYDGKAVTGGTIVAYRVGQVQETDGNYSFVKTETMGTFEKPYDDVTSAALAEDIADYVEENNLTAYAVTKNSDGKAVFSNLEPGLYLVAQTEASAGYEPLKPFLVSVPMKEDGNDVYDVNADGKFQLQQESKTTTEKKPSGSTLPQTGQLNWPIPVLVVLGLVLFSVGWLLRFGRKKNGYEK